MTQQTCRWRPSHGEGCGRQAHGQREYCIFHLPEKKEHEIEEFAKALREEIESQRRRDPNKLDFEGFHFPCQIDLRDMLAAKHLFPPTIEQDLWFPGCTFEQGLVAHEVQFLGHVLFGDALFRKGVSFIACTFRGIADFCHATFEGDAWFSSARFREASFTFAVFRSCAMFPDAEFLGDAYFPSVTFEDDSFSPIRLSSEMLCFTAPISGRMSHSIRQLSREMLSSIRPSSAAPQTSPARPF